jgi:Lrp/AsnC family leucine-responsive transcriptional regulator
MKKTYKVDEIDIKIIDMLKINGRLQWREIGEEIHLSGQAVVERVRRLIAEEIITGFHVSVNESSLAEGKRTDFVTAIMTTSDHQGFVNLVEQIEEIKELYRISGNGCYMLKIVSNNQEEVNDILERLLEYANYSMNSVVKKLK